MTVKSEEACTASLAGVLDELLVGGAPVEANEPSALAVGTSLL